LFLLFGNTNLNADAFFNSATAPYANNPNGNLPKAYIYVDFFNEKFEFVSEGSMSLRVSQQGNNASPLVLSNIKAPRNGYAYVYLSNESNEPVYFDDFKVSDTRGRIIEENHYYAFGLRIAGISSVKLGDPNEGSLKNNNLYNDKELFDDADLSWYDYGFRSYDPQIGRFQQLDPLTDRYPELTPYQYASDEPIANVDMDGLEAIGSTVASSVGDAVVKSSSFMPNIVVQGLSKAAVAQKTFNAINIGINAFKIGAALGDHTQVIKMGRDLDVPLTSGKRTGGIPFTTNSGNGTDNPDHATDPSNPVNIDGLFDLFSWTLKAKPHPLKPDFNSPDDALGLLNDVTKELGGNSSGNMSSHENKASQTENSIYKPMVWVYLSQRTFDTIDKGKYIKKIGKDSSLFFDPNGNDTGKVIIFKFGK
jgi:RHS repeat-associated protein